MKKIASFILLFVLLITLSGCSFTLPTGIFKTTTKKPTTTTVQNGNDTTTIKNITTTTKNSDEKEKLETPIVVIDDLGNVSWKEIPGAVKYHYVIEKNGSSSEYDTTNTSGVKLSLGESIKVKAIANEESNIDSDYSTSKTYSITLNKIDAPTVRIEKGFAKWDQIEGAIGYGYKIYEKTSALTETLIEEGIVGIDEYIPILVNNSIEVYTISGLDDKGDSAYSGRVTATVSNFTPVLSIDSDGFATWTKSSETDYYRYSINGSEEFKVTSETRFRVENNSTFKVKPVYYYAKDNVYYEITDVWNWSNEERSTWSNREPVKVSTPNLSFNEDYTKIVWEKDDNAKEYNYKFVGQSTYYSTTDNYIELSRISGGSGIVVKAVGYAGYYLDSDYSDPIYPKPINTPMVTINDTGKATWTKLDDAEGYYYIKNDDEPVYTRFNAITLEVGDTIRVKAYSSKYLEGEYGINKTYSGTPFTTLSKSRIDSMSSTYYYDKLATYSNGTKMQEFYRTIDNLVYNFYKEYRTVSKDEAILEERYSTLSLTDNDIKIIFTSYRNDHPFYYFIRNSYSYGTYFKLYVDDDVLNGDTRRQYDKNIIEMVDEYVGYSALKTTEYEKAKIVHDLIVRDMEYAYDSNGNPLDASYAHTVVGPATYGTGVCESYSRLYEMVMNVIGIECVFVSGTGVTTTGSEAHAWNIVKINNNWYYLDMTWDDNMSSTATVYYYFLVAEGEVTTDGLTFSQQHYPNTTDGLKIPTVTSTPLNK